MMFLQKLLHYTFNNMQIVVFVTFLESDSICFAIRVDLFPEKFLYFPTFVT